jgi:tRNA nucleotidyltransferase (CCA-adding enzyme)
MSGSGEINPAHLRESLDSLIGIEELRRAAGDERAYLVGGAVRDLLLGRTRTDLDLAVDGDVGAIARALGEDITTHERFGTATVRVGDLVVDLARSRAESYERPGALPTVSPAPIAEDLARRDFTINAMAVPLTGEAELIDPHGGLGDLRAGLLRVLHERSFVDDPTRALRAARYAARFDLGLEPGTEKLLRAADLSTVSDDRVQAELRRIAAEDDPAGALALILEWGVMPSLDSGAPERVGAVADLASRPPWAGWAERELAVSLAIVRPLPQIRELAAATPERPSEVVRLAEPWDPAQQLVARALGAEWLDRYAEELRHVGLEISGDDLIREGVPEGPAIGRGLEAALSGKLDGELSGRDEELRIALAVARGEIPED